MRRWRGKSDSQPTLSTQPQGLVGLVPRPKRMPQSRKAQWRRRQVAKRKAENQVWIQQRQARLRATEKQKATQEAAKIGRDALYNDEAQRASNQEQNEQEDGQEPKVTHPSWKPNEDEEVIYLKLPPWRQKESSSPNQQEEVTGAGACSSSSKKITAKKQLPHWRRLPPLIQGGVINKKVKATRAHPQGQGEALHGTFYGMASLMRTIHLDRIWLGKDVAGMPRRGLTKAGWRVVMSAA